MLLIHKVRQAYIYYELLAKLHLIIIIIIIIIVIVVGFILQMRLGISTQESPPVYRTTAI